MQAVLRGFEQPVFVGEGPQAPRQLVPLAKEFPCAIWLELGPREAVKDILTLISRDIDDPRCLGFQRTQSVLLLIAQHLSRR